MKRLGMALFAVLALAIVAAPGFAQDEAPAAPAAPEKEKPEKKEGATLDELSRSTLESYREKTYQLDQQDVKKASFDIVVNINHPMQQMKVKGAVLYDGDKATITWDNPMMASQFGQMETQMSDMFKDKPIEESYGTAKLTATKKDDGTVVIAVDGKNPQSLTEMTFSPEGLMIASKAKQESQMGPMDVSSTYTYAKAGDTDKVYASHQTVTMDTPMGPMTRKVENTLDNRQGVLVPVKTKITMDQMGQTFDVVVDFENWKLNDEVGKSTEKTPEEKPADEGAPKKE